MPLPIIRKTQTVAQVGFQDRGDALTFSNGVERVYERLPAIGSREVIVVAVNANDELLLIENTLRFS